MKPVFCLILLGALSALSASAHADYRIPRRQVAPAVIVKAFDEPSRPSSWKAALVLASARRELWSCFAIDNSKNPQPWLDPLTPTALSPFEPLKLTQKQPSMKNASRYAPISSRTPDGYHVGPPF